MNILKFRLRNSRKLRIAVSRRGFSLVELLVVISIIMLLLGILMPAINRALMGAYNANSKTAVTELNGMAMSFYDEHKFFPGQKGVEVGDTDHGADCASGSQVLAYCLFGMVNWDNYAIDTSDPSGKHLSYSQEKVMEARGHDYVLSDRNTPKPILYFVSNRGNPGTTIGGAFTIGDNGTIISAGDCATGSTSLPTSTGSDDYWWSSTFGKATNYDTFLLIAPGMDGEYYNNDDLINK
ncbi:MAG: type II secretion system GspH family protein [Phycisphaerae bacterium]|nr:type II secretion system GspH family protein [Phycisphaerae bacterium]